MRKRLNGPNRREMNTGGAERSGKGDEDKGRGADRMKDRMRKRRRKQKKRGKTVNKNMKVLKKQ